MAEFEPQFPSTLVPPTFAVEDGLADEDVELGVADEGVELGVADEIEEDELLASLLPHVPNPLWHPVPQYVTFSPQYPFSEQQFPNVLP